MNDVGAAAIRKQSA